MDWWRVEFGDQGQIKRVERCPKGDDQTRRIFYVEANDSDGAKLKAYRKRQAEALKIRRAQYRREGRCKCGREREDESAALCSLCRERRRRDARNCRARNRGEEPPEPTAGKASAFNENRATARDADRASILLEVARRFERSNTVREFADWLAGELRAVGIHSTRRADDEAEPAPESKPSNVVGIRSTRRTG